MGTFRCDTFVPEHIKTSVGAADTVSGDAIVLSGAVGIAVQVVCSNGAAGTLYCQATNQQGKNAVWSILADQAFATNQNGVVSFSLTDQLTSMQKMRCWFISSAAGDVQVSVNARCVTY